ncbi:MAG: alpha/beta fold hydrolase [Sneathiella sp.]|nr:alpha/beta fold hydrolase [Sneathiella sp.]
MEQRLAAIMMTDMYGFSRLMEQNASVVIARQKAHRKEFIDPEISANEGHIIKTTGDGLLVEFSSAHKAIRCALKIQAGMPQREKDRDYNERIQYRIGINVGDVVFDEGDMFGDGVNVAARLEGLAEPGGICVSDQVYQMTLDELSDPFRDLGNQKVKNIERLIRVWQWSPDVRQKEAKESAAALNQEVNFCISSDDTQIAYARVGTGPVLFKAPNWLNHIDYEWRSPVWGPLLSTLAEKFELVRFDQRGNGLSDWDVEEISEDAMIADMEAVVDAANLDQFVLLGISQGCAFSIRYALQHPEKVRALILFGGFVRGMLTRNSKEQESLFAAAKTIIKQGWGSTNPAFRHLFTSMFIPDATPDQADSFDELQRVCAAPENAVRIFDMNAHVDMTELARKINVPTLVLHCRGDSRVPVSEGRRIAANIPGAKFVDLPGNNHVVLEGTPEFKIFFEEIDAFIKNLDG